MYTFLRLKISLGYKFGSMVPISMFSRSWKNWQTSADINIYIRNPFQCQLTRASNIWKRGSDGNCRMGGHSNIPSVDGTPGKYSLSRWHPRKMGGIPPGFCQIGESISSRPPNFAKLSGVQEFPPSSWNLSFSPLNQKLLQPGDLVHAPSSWSQGS